MERDTRLPEPAPGWTPGTCYCGCGYPIKRSRPDKDRPTIFYSRTHRSVRAPDGRLVTEFTTKWCQTCSRRLPLEDFPIRVKRRKEGYVERRGFYCHTCHKAHLREINEQPHVKEAARLRARDMYSNPVMRERILAANRQRHRETMADPVRHEQLKQRRREERRAYLERLKQDPMRWAKFLQAEADRNARQREERRQRRLDKVDPLVLKPDDPQRAWLYEQMVNYATIRDMSLRDLFPDRDMSKWKHASKTSGSRYMKLDLVDEVLVRLDLQHHLGEFTFYRRSELTGRKPSAKLIGRERASQAG